MFRFLFLAMMLAITSAFMAPAMSPKLSMSKLRMDESTRDASALSEWDGIWGFDRQKEIFEAWDPSSPRTYTNFNPGFDYYCSSLTPEGRLFQVEYAEKAVESSSTIMGVVCKDGIILGTEKIVINKMMVSGTDKRINSVTKNVGCVVNGMVPDGRSIMFRAREECDQYEKNFGVKTPGAVLAERMALQFHQRTVYASYRPYGTSVIFATYDVMKGPQLFMIDPSSQMYQYYGCASGRGKQLCRNEIEKGKFREQTVEEALPKVAKMLLKAQDEMKEKKMEIELSVLSDKTGWFHKIIDRVQCDKLCADAQAAIDNEDEEMN